MLGARNAPDQQNQHRDGKATCVGIPLRYACAIDDTYLAADYRRRMEGNIPSPAPVQRHSRVVGKKNLPFISCLRDAFNAENARPYKDLTSEQLTLHTCSNHC